MFNAAARISYAVFIVSITASATLAQTDGNNTADRAASAADGASTNTTRLENTTWIIEEIDGRVTTGDPKPNILFLKGDQLAGHGSCNRIFAGYTLDGETMAITAIGSSMMMCSDELMEQERRFVEILEAVTQWSVDEAGNLILRATDERTIHGSRE